MLTRELTKLEEKQIFESLIEANFKPKNKVNITRLIIDIQIQLVLMAGFSNLFVYVYQLLTCPAC